MGFPGDSVVKNLLAIAGEVGLIPGSGRSLGEGIGNPPQYSCLGNPMDREAWQVTVHRVTKSRTWLKWLSTHTHCIFQDYLGPFWIPFIFKWITEIHYKLLGKKTSSCDFNRNCIETADQLGDCCHFNNNKSFCSMNMGLFLFISVCSVSSVMSDSFWPHGM